MSDDQADTVSITWGGLRIVGYDIAADVDEPTRKRLAAALDAQIERTMGVVLGGDARAPQAAPSRCCNGFVLHAPDCETWGSLT